MARQRDWERLKATERGRHGEPCAPTERHHPERPAFGHLSHPPAPHQAYWLRRSHAHVLPPDPRHPYFTVRTAQHAFLGAGATRERAIWNAMARTRARHDAPRD